jgi:hypothetical protein
MTGPERNRVYQYSFRKYDSLGPKSLGTARQKLCQKIMATTNITKIDFDDIISDLIDENKWSESRAMAYFECISIEDRI